MRISKKEIVAFANSEGGEIYVGVDKTVISPVLKSGTNDGTNWKYDS